PVPGAVLPPDPLAPPDAALRGLDADETERVKGGREESQMLLSLFLTCVVALGVSTALLLLLGHRLRFSLRILGVLLAALVMSAYQNCLTFVSLHIAPYNEPPDMLIETIKSVEALDYPHFEVVVIDNNTEDPEVWQPVERYCKGHSRVRFVHVENLSGYKAGALNLALRDHTDPDAEL